MRPVVYPMVYSLAMGYEDSDHHLKLLHRGANDLMLLHTSFEFENGINKSYIVQYLIWAKQVYNKTSQLLPQLLKKYMAHIVA